MAIFALAVRTTGTGSGAAAAEIIAGASTAYRMLEFGLTISAAVTSVFGLGAPAAKGTTPATSAVLVAEDSGNTTAGVTQIALSWSTGPTVPANYIRRVSLPNTIGAGIVWTFPRGRTRLLATTDVLFNPLAVTSISDIWCVVDE